MDLLSTRDSFLPSRLPVRRVALPRLRAKTYTTHSEFVSKGVEIYVLLRRQQLGDCLRSCWDFYIYDCSSSPQVNEVRRSFIIIRMSLLDRSERDIR